MTVGLSGAGKSTYSENICKTLNAVHLASDKVRDAVYGSRRHQDNPRLIFEICQKSAVENLKQGRNVVLDATNLISKNRIQTLQAVKKEIPNARCEAHVVITPFNECIKQNVTREYAIPRTVLERQYSQFQIPFMEEGWDEIKLIPPDGWHFALSDGFTVREIHRLGDDFDQHTPYHNFKLGDHCASVGNYVRDILFEKIEDDSVTSEFMAMATAAEIHDYGKLFGHTEDKDGVWHYYGHAEKGTYEFLCNCLEPWKAYSDADDLLIRVAFYINYHMLPFNWNSEKEKAKAQKTFGKEKYDLLMLLHEADIHGKDIPAKEV